MKSFVTFIAALVLGACGSPDPSSLTHPPKKGVFPIYATVPGNHAGEGKIYRIPAPADLGAQSTPELVLDNLNFPTALQVLVGGGFYYTESPPGGSGRLLKYVDEASAPEEVLAGLAEPVGVVVDTAEQVFVLEKQIGRLSRVDGNELTPIKEDLLNPMTMTIGGFDGMFVTEAGASRLVRVLANGESETIIDGLTAPRDGGIGLVGSTFALAQGSGIGTGSVVAKNSDGSQETYLSRLIQPTAMAWEDGSVLLVAEGTPSYRIIQYSKVTNARISIASFDSEVGVLAMTPLE